VVPIDLVDTAAPVGKESREVLPRDTGGASGFVDIEDNGAAVAGHTTAALRTAGVDNAEIAVVDQGHAQMESIHAHYVRIVLGIEPLTGIAAREGKVTALTEFPQDVAGTIAVLVVDFNDPALVANRKDKIAVVRCIDDGIAMRPVG